MTHFRIPHQKTEMILTILIPTLWSRIDKLAILVKELNFQIQNKPVQILWLGDNKSISVGEKRNKLIEMSLGQWFCFIDDDDKIAKDYIYTILKAIEENPTKTVICFEGKQNSDGAEDLPFMYDVRFGRNFKQVVDGVRYKCMLPDHLCVWQKSKVSERFPDSSLGEDHEFAKTMAFHYTANEQFLLKKFLYLYEFNRNESECRR